jgi:hypothetical protein
VSVGVRRVGRHGVVRIQDTGRGEPGYEGVVEELVDEVAECEREGDFGDAGPGTRDRWRRVWRAKGVGIGRSRGVGLVGAW